MTANPHNEADRKNLRAEAQVEAVAHGLAEFIGYAWDGLYDHSCEERGFKPFFHGTMGWGFQGGKADLRNAARKLLKAAEI